tara:strand:+ start:1979 stop:3517 length:1539 start_codon:yes stop_codon:yes gene_type:complete
MRALISVYDKTGIVEFAKNLINLEYEIISTGGTAKLLRENNIEVTDVSNVTQHPEILNGRVKTMHPKVLGGILALDTDEHNNDLLNNSITKIDLVVVNLYPFEETIAKENVNLQEVLENIDIGGPSLLRSAAKNFKLCLPICDPNDYGEVISGITSNNLIREKFAVKVFEKTADYDVKIHSYLSEKLNQEKILRLKFKQGEILRYGENSHQSASFYKFETKEPCVANTKKLHGKELSYNNIIDIDSALEVVKELNYKNTVSVVKHNNPCGLATGETVKEALEAAWSGDQVSAFGSIIAISSTIDIEAATFLENKFVEVIIAPNYTEEALNYLKQKSKNLRILKTGELFSQKNNLCYKSVTGGILEQSKDNINFIEWECVTQTSFPENKINLAKFTNIAAKNTKSNAVVLGYEYKLGYFKVLGMGAGQPNRIDSLRKLAVPKAIENLGSEDLSEVVLASDAFFPFDDTVREAASYGIKFIIQPGGSIRDNEVINACNELNVAMAFTKARHFLH